jgi:plasmid maintenance system antidote protein VapI
LSRLLRLGQASPDTDLTDADVLEHLLEAKDVKQAEVARATGIRDSRISQVVTGKRQLTRTQIVR